jgi:uncharacterized membrane protein
VEEAASAGEVVAAGRSEAARSAEEGRPVTGESKGALSALRFGGGVLCVVGALDALAGAAWLAGGGMADRWDQHPWIAPAAVIVVGLTMVAVGLVLLARGAAKAHSAPANFLSDADEARVLEAIGSFESKTSGEIRVHLAHHMGGDIMASAKGAFESLGLTATKERNGVLFFVAVRDHKFAVLGDSGINARVPPGFWDEIVRHVHGRFVEGRFGDGLVEGLEKAGTALAAHFPRRADDVNELPDAISREK